MLTYQFYMKYMLNKTINMLNQILDWSKGNTGAIIFLMKLTLPENSILGISIIQLLMEAKTISGSNLYVLWNDLANKDLDVVRDICFNTPIDILEDACSREDRSGIKLISKYV